MLLACVKRPSVVRFGLYAIYLVVFIEFTSGTSFASVFGSSHKGEKPVLSCTAEPAEVAAGQEVTLSARGMDLPSGTELSYRWTTSGGTVMGDGATVSLDTKGLAPGTYTAGARLVDGKRVEIVVSCTTIFVMEAPVPPTVSCTADRAAINSGDVVTVTAAAKNPAGRELTYSYATTNGKVEGNGTSATLSTNGATPGGITVTCTVADDLGRTAFATASVVVATPAAPPPSATVQRLCGLSFERDRRRPDRVDNEAKGCLDEVALDLNRDATATLLITGHYDGREAAQNAAVRALNAREYLTQEKRIDGGRVQVGVSDLPGRSDDTTLIPAGKTLIAKGFAGFNEGHLRRRGEAYGRPTIHDATQRHRRRRHRWSDAWGRANAGSHRE